MYEEMEPEYISLPKVWNGIVLLKDLHVFQDYLGYKSSS